MARIKKRKQINGGYWESKLIIWLLSDSSGYGTYFESSSIMHFLEIPWVLGKYFKQEFDNDICIVFVDKARDEFPESEDRIIEIRAQLLKRLDDENQA